MVVWKSWPNGGNEVVIMCEPIHGEYYGEIEIVEHRPGTLFIWKCRTTWPKECIDKSVNDVLYRETKIYGCANLAMASIVPRMPPNCACCGRPRVGYEFLAQSTENLPTDPKLRRNNLHFTVHVAAVCGDKKCLLSLKKPLAKP